MDNIAVIILNYITWEETLKEIDIVKSLNASSQLDIIVVENNSPNNSYNCLLEHSKNNFILIKSENNNGYASGNNLGLRYCFQKGYKYAWILNNDILIEDRDIVAKLISVFNDDSVAVVNPDIYTPEKHLYNRDSSKPSFYDLTLGMFRYRKKGRIIKDIGGYGYVYRPQGCCMMVDLSKMREVDYLDEYTFLYFEEVILAERLIKKDYKCACCLDCSVIHNHSKTVKSSIKRRQIAKIQLESFNYYLRKYRNFGVLKRFICRLFYKLKLCLMK